MNTMLLLTFLRESYGVQHTSSKFILFNTVISISYARILLFLCASTTRRAVGRLFLFCYFFTAALLQPPKKTTRLTQ